MQAPNNENCIGAMNSAGTVTATHAKTAAHNAPHMVSIETARHHTHEIVGKLDQFIELATECRQKYAQYAMNLPSMQEMGVSHVQLPKPPTEKLYTFLNTLGYGKTSKKKSLHTKKPYAKKSDGRSKPNPWILWKKHTADHCTGIDKYQRKAKASSHIWKRAITGSETLVKESFSAHCRERGYENEMSEEDKQEVFDSWFSQYPELADDLAAFTEDTLSPASSPAPPQMAPTSTMVVMSPTLAQQQALPHAASPFQSIATMSAEEATVDTPMDDVAAMEAEATEDAQPEDSLGACNAAQDTHDTLGACNAAQDTHDTLGACNAAQDTHDTLGACNAAQQDDETQLNTGGDSLFD